MNNVSAPRMPPSRTISLASSLSGDASHAAPAPGPRLQVKRVTLTSKKNWWMVEMDDEEEPPPNQSTRTFASDETVDVLAPYHHRAVTPTPHRQDESPERAPSPFYRPPRHPSSIFSFPTPTAYAAPPNSTAGLATFAHGSASELFKCVVKKPDIVQLEVNGEMQSNASDVTVQFLAELRVYTTLPTHPNICAFLGCLENVGMVLEYIDGRTLYDVVAARPPLNEAQKVDYHNQLLRGLTHLHEYGLSHGDLSLLNVQVTNATNTIKLLDFGRSVSSASTLRPPDDEPVDPFVALSQRQSPHAPLSAAMPKVEQIHPGTRPFSAPEILRGECTDALLADAYSFGMILVCLDRCESVDVKPWDQRKDLLPKNFFDGCIVFEERAREYLRKWNMDRRRLVKEDIMDVLMG
ncbi:kinase-like domain-containing protein [Schizophyllum commune]